MKDKDIVQFSLSCAVISIVLFGVMLFIALNMHAARDKALADKRTLYSQIKKVENNLSNQSKAVTVMLNELQKVKSLREVDMILAKLKLKRIAVYKKEYKNEPLTPAPVSQGNTR